MMNESTVLPYDIFMEIIPKMDSNSLSLLAQCSTETNKMVFNFISDVKNELNKKLNELFNSPYFDSNLFKVTVESNSPEIKIDESTEIVDNICVITIIINWIHPIYGPIKLKNITKGKFANYQPYEQFVTDKNGNKFKMRLNFKTEVSMLINITSFVKKLVFI